MAQEVTLCPSCGGSDTTAHVQTVIAGPGAAIHSVGWRCLDCQHIWGHEGVRGN